MFQRYQPCCVRCHVYTVQLCWPKRLRLLPRGRFLPAQLILFDVHLESRHAEPRGTKLCTGGRMGSTGLRGWAAQPLRHPERTDAHCSCSLVRCFRMRGLEDGGCSRPQG